MPISNDHKDNTWSFSPSATPAAAIEISIEEVTDPRTDLGFASFLRRDPQGLRTYLIIDPNLRKAVTGVFDLDTVDVPARSLFDGKAAEESEEVAPYLVDATVESEDRIPRFNRDFLDRHWGQNTALIVRSHGSFDTVRKHLRKFTKVRRETSDKWFFFRFWDPKIASIYFRTVQNSTKRAEQWFGRDLIDSYIVEEANGQQLAVLRPGAPFQPSNAPIRSVILTDWELQPFSNSAYERDINKMATALKADFKAELKSYSPEVVSSLIRPTLSRFAKYGFRRKEHLYVIAAWGLFFGPDFIDKDREGTLEKICRAQEPEAKRFAALKKRMGQFGTPEAEQ